MEEEIDIKNLIIALWKKKWIIIIITIIFAFFGIIKYGGFNKTKQTVIEQNNDKIYISQASFIIGKEEKITQTDGQTMLDNGTVVPVSSTVKTENHVNIDDKFISTLNHMVTSKSVLDKVITELELKNIVSEDLQSKILIINENYNDFFKIIVSYNDKEKAISIVKVLLSELNTKLNELYSINGIIVVDEPYILSESEINNLSDYIDVKTSEIVQSTNKGINIKKIVLFAVIGFVLGCGIVVVFELFNETVKTEEDLENATKLKTLIKINNTDEDISEKFKILRVNIKECKTILITSPEKKDGKTFVAENLAKSFAMLGKKVILLDLTKNENELIKKYNGKGLSDFLFGQDKFIEKYAVESEINNLSILPVGSKMSNLTELLEEPKMKEALSTLEQLYDVVIIDSDNVLESPNTLAIAKISKYSILVSSERKTKLENVVKAKVNIEDVGGSVIGNILNKTK